MQIPGGEHNSVPSYSSYYPSYCLSPFGLAWGILTLYIFLPEHVAVVFGQLTGNHPLFFSGRVCARNRGIHGCCLQRWPLGSSPLPREGDFLALQRGLVCLSDHLDSVDLYCRLCDHRESPYRAVSICVLDVPHIWRAK